MKQKQTPQYIKDMHQDMKILISDLKMDISEIRDDISELKSDVSELKSNVAILKSDMSDVKIRLTTLETDVSDLKDITQHMLKHMATQDQFESLNQDVLYMKNDIHEIMRYIGRYEVRSQNLEDTIFHDHKPRIVDLENVVYN